MSVALGDPFPHPKMMRTSRKRAGDVDEYGCYTRTLFPCHPQVPFTHVASTVSVAHGRDPVPKGGQVRAPCDVWRGRTVARPESAESDHPQRFAALAS